MSGPPNVSQVRFSANQDEIYLTSKAECHLREEEAGQPIYIRADQPAATKLGVLFVCWSYFGYFLSVSALAVSRRFPAPD